MTTFYYFTIYLTDGLEAYKIYIMEDQDEIINPPPDSRLPRLPDSLNRQAIGGQASSSFGIPQAIFSGLVIIGISIYLSFGVPNNKAAVQGTSVSGNSSSSFGSAVKVEVSADDDPVLGSANAKVTVIEFSDFQCPYCRKLWRETLPLLKRDYIDKGLAKLVYRDFPLPQIHPSAEIAAEAGECAHEQGKFWEMHDKIFAEQDKQGENTVTFSQNDLKKWAGEIGIDISSFNACLVSGKYREEIAKDEQAGIAAGVGGTPGTFVNGKLINGAQLYEIFKQAIDEALR